MNTTSLVFTIRFLFSRLPGTLFAKAEANQGAMQEQLHSWSCGARHQGSWWGRRFRLPLRNQKKTWQAKPPAPRMRAPQPQVLIEDRLQGIALEDNTVPRIAHIAVLAEPDHILGNDFARGADIP